MTVGLILMTALVPTVGHKYIIDFASNFVDTVYVIVSGRSFEPVPLMYRVESLHAATRVRIVSHEDDNAPQNPKGPDDVEFWNYWKNVILQRVPVPINYVFASEFYGQKVADIINADFIPVDIAREVMSVKSTSVRKNLFKNHSIILPEFKHYIKMNVVLFGQESCGKTTMAKALAKKFKGQFVPEWARPYLETVGVNVTEFKMFNIVKGQTAQELTVTNSNALITFKDTDLLSTLGFYELWGITKPVTLHYNVNYLKNDLYIVMNDNIPFEADPLRYGGNARETDKQYWINLLERFNRNYYVVKETEHKKQLEEINKVILNYKLLEGMTYKNIMEFERE